MPTLLLSGLGSELTTTSVGSSALNDDNEPNPLPTDKKELFKFGAAHLAEVRMFFTLSLGQVLESDGQDRAALEVLKEAEEDIRRLPDKHPMKDALNNLVATAHYHIGDFKQARACRVPGRPLGSKPVASVGSQMRKWSRDLQSSG